MKTIISGIVLFSSLLFNFEAHAELYTRTQSLVVPGMPCQLILISVFDDMGTPTDHSDDTHLRTDAFLRCGDSINEIKRNNANEESPITETMILPGSLRTFIESNSKVIQKADKESYDFLIEVSSLFDACKPFENCNELFDKLNIMPDYLKSNIQLYNEIKLQDYIKKIELDKNEK